MDNRRIQTGEHTGNFRCFILSGGDYTTKVIACYVVFNEEENIARSIRSVKAYVDGVVIVDACFKSNTKYGAEITHSTDNTMDAAIDACKDIPLEYIEAHTRLNEQEARNLYLRCIEEGDWALYIDGDEVLYGEYSSINSMFKDIHQGVYNECISCRVYTEVIKYAGMGVDMPRREFDENPIINTCGFMSKLFRMKKGHHYITEGRVTEHAIYDKDDVLVTTGMLNRTCSFFIINHHLRQSHESYQNDGVWALNQRPWDKKST